MGMNNANTPREIYTPSKGYALSLPSGQTQIERWEIVGRRVYVEYRDGLVAHSEHTPGEVRAIGVRA